MLRLRLVAARSGRASETRILIYRTRSPGPNRSVSRVAASTECRAAATAFVVHWLSRPSTVRPPSGPDPRRNAAAQGAATSIFTPMSLSTRFRKSSYFAHGASAVFQFSCGIPLVLAGNPETQTRHAPKVRATVRCRELTGMRNARGIPTW